MIRICALAVVLSLLFCSCKKGDSSASKPMYWPGVESSLKSYAESIGGEYHLMRQSHMTGSSFRNCGILLPCGGPELSSHEAHQELMKVVKGVFEACNVRSFNMGSDYPHRDSSTGKISLSGGGTALRMEAWGGVGGAFLRVTGRMVCPRDDKGLGEYEVARRSAKPIPEGTLIWLRIDSINQNTPKEED